MTHVATVLLLNKDLFIGVLWAAGGLSRAVVQGLILRISAFSLGGLLMTAAKMVLTIVMVLSVALVAFADEAVGSDPAAEASSGAGAMVANQPTAEGAPMPSAAVVKAAPTLTNAANAADASGVPYVGKIVGDAVNVRSGPAEVYYAVTQVGKGQLVIVLAERRGRRNWARVEPMAGCFSYISKQYVKLMPSGVAEGEVAGAADATVAAVPDAAAEIGSADPMAQGADAVMADTSILAGDGGVTLGVVTGSNVRVRAGSIKVPPANADQVQAKLSRGSVVQVVGERDDYYKIVCPEGSSFWVSLDYIERVGPITEPVATQLRTEMAVVAAGGEVGVPMTPEGHLLDDRAEYMAIAAMFRAEQAKAVLQRDLQAVRARLDALEARTASPSVKASAAAMGRMLSRAETVQQIVLKAHSENDQLYVTLAEIDRKTQATLAEGTVVRPFRTVMMGRLSKSGLSLGSGGRSLFHVRDENEEIVMFAVAGSDRLELDEWAGGYVSLAGIVRHEAILGAEVLYVTNVGEQIEPSSGADEVEETVIVPEVDEAAGAVPAGE